MRATLAARACLVGWLVVLAACIVGWRVARVASKPRRRSNSKKQHRPPNIVVIMTDDMGYADVGFNGCTDIPTPNIDSIAHQGIRFTNGYVSSPVCGPSRAGFMTGRYQDRFGFVFNPSNDPENRKAGLPLEEKTMAEVLKRADYESAVVGKWHLGTHDDFHPLDRGFDHFYGFLSGGHSYFPRNFVLEDLSEVTKKYEWYSAKIVEDRSTIETDDYLTDELSNAAVRFINKNLKEKPHFMLFRKRLKEKPHFMLYLAYNAPHGPLMAPKKYLDRFGHIADKRRKTYAAMVSAVDDGVGRVLEAIRKGKAEENTIIVFLSDNGGSKNNAAQNKPLKGFKRDLYEGGLRVPFAIQWQGVLPADMIYDKSVSSLDIMATIMELNGIPEDPERPLDGVNLMPYLTGENKDDPHDYLFWRKLREKKDKVLSMAVRHGSHKLIAAKNVSLPPRQQLIEKELFDLSVDTNEKHNISERDPAIFEALVKAWKIWGIDMKDPAFFSPKTDKWWKRNRRSDDVA